MRAILFVAATLIAIGLFFFGALFYAEVGRQVAHGSSVEGVFVPSLLGLAAWLGCQFMIFTAVDIAKDLARDTEAKP